MESNMRLKHTSFILIAFLSIFLSFNCSSDKNGETLKSSGLLLVGNDIAGHDKKSGVTQASPGLKFTPPSSGLIDVPADRSLLRFKLFDDPVPNPGTNGFVKLVLETRDLKTCFEGFFNHALNDKDTIIELNVEKIAIETEKKHDKRRFKDRIETYYPTADDARIYFNSRRDYTMVVKGISLPEGNYRGITISFRHEGKLYYKNDKEYPVKLLNNSLTYHRDFHVENGKITTLLLSSIKHTDNYHGRKKENGDNKNASINMNNFAERAGYKGHYITFSPHSRCFKKWPHTVPLTFRGFHPADATISDPVSQAFIIFNNLSIVNNDGQSLMLNEVKTEIELLSLRNGAVAMMGSNVVPEGVYKYFEMSLSTGHHVVVGGQSYPLTIEKWLYDSLRFMGPFDLRGGRITEVFIQFDPNRSLFYIRGKGYILEPDIFVASVVSLTPVQELRLVESLGMIGNQVMSQAELIFQGRVSTITNVLANNIYGKKMIYSDVVLSVEDRLRGTINAGTYTLRAIGGSYNGINLKVPGMPEFSSGERVLLFLKNYNDRMSVVYGEYGKITVP
jgi:hypothetical protein